ncbi:MAG: CHRD domain-containing protein [Acidimicrobiia bacterium]
MRRMFILIVIVAVALAVAVPAVGSHLRFEAELTGAEEVPPVATNTTGRAGVEFNHTRTRAAFRVQVSDGEAVTQAHFHCAPEGVNGPVVAFLFGFIPGGFDVDGELAEFTLTDANILADATPSETCPVDINTLADLARAMGRGLIYANVHTVANPGGEVRGQMEQS